MMAPREWFWIEDDGVVVPLLEKSPPVFERERLCLSPLAHIYGEDGKCVFCGYRK